MIQAVRVLARSAEAVGRGELLSPRAHFGLGVIVVDGWIVQNPSFSGYAALQAYLPSRRLAVAVSTTKTAETADGTTAEVVAERIAAHLAPDVPLGSAASARPYGP